MSTNGNFSRTKVMNFFYLSSWSDNGDDFSLTLEVREMSSRPVAYSSLHWHSTIHEPNSESKKSLTATTLSSFPIP